MAKSNDIPRYAPIVIFVYNRPEHTKRLLQSLSRNSIANKSHIYIYSDAAKDASSIEKVATVREVINNFKRTNPHNYIVINEAKTNKGLACSVIEGVSDVIKKYKKVIVLEDDLILSDVFLEYMNNALEIYKKNPHIWSISGYNVPLKVPEDYTADVYLSYRGCSWGWATWDDRWEKVDWAVKDYDKFKYNLTKRRRLNRGGNDMARMLDAQMEGLIDSWAIRWCYTQSLKNMYTVYPIKSLVRNGGLDGSGTHSGTSTKFDVRLHNTVPTLPNNIGLNARMTKNFKKCFASQSVKPLLREIMMLLRLDFLIDILHKFTKH